MNQLLTTDMAVLTFKKDVGNHSRPSLPFVNKFLKDFNKDVYLEPVLVKCKWGCYYYEELKSGCVGSTAVSFSNNL